MKIGNLEAIAWHLEQGEDNGGITREALALFLRSVAKELKIHCTCMETVELYPTEEPICPTHGSFE